MKSPITPASTASAPEGYPRRQSSGLDHEAQQANRPEEVPPSMADRTFSYLPAKAKREPTACRLLHSSRNSAFEVDDVEAEQLIKMYQEEMTHQTPFVVVPHDITASDLRTKKPILFKAVMMATSYEYPSRQAYYERQMAEQISEQVLLGGQKNLETLQAILLLIAWGVYIITTVSAIR